MEALLTSQSIDQQELLQKAQATGKEIQQYENEERQNRRLSRPTFDALKNAGFLRMYLPQSLGGLEADPVTVAKIIEETALHNTAAGWALMVANATSWWCGRLPEKAMDEILDGDPDTIVASAFHPPKAALRSDGGFIINGRGPLYSNINESKWVFMTAMVMEDGAMKMHNGQPVVIGAIMKTSECEIIDTWHTIGMQATNSNDVATKDVFVPDHRVFYLIPEFKPNSHFTGPLYKFPAVGVNLTSLLPPVTMAIARKAIEEIKIIAFTKTPLGSFTPLAERSTVQSKLGKAEALLESARAYLYQNLNSCWEKVQSGKSITMEDRGQLLLAAVNANMNSVQAVDLVYSIAGSSAIYTRSKLAYHFMDAQVLRQHGFMNESRYETAAQVMLGKEPDLPVVLF